MSNFFRKQATLEQTVSELLQRGLITPQAALELYSAQGLTYGSPSRETSRRAGDEDYGTRQSYIDNLEDIDEDELRRQRENRDLAALTIPPALLGLTGLYLNKDAPTTGKKVWPTTRATLAGVGIGLGLREYLRSTDKKTE